MSDTPRFAVPVLPENSDPGKPLRRVTRTEYEAFRRRPVLLPVAECSQFSLLLEDHEALDDELFKLGNVADFGFDHRPDAINRRSLIMRFTIHGGCIQLEWTFYNLDDNATIDGEVIYRNLFHSLLDNYMISGIMVSLGIFHLADFVRYFAVWTTGDWALPQPIAPGDDIHLLQHMSSVRSVTPPYTNSAVFLLTFSACLQPVRINLGPASVLIFSICN